MDSLARATSKPAPDHPPVVMTPVEATAAAGEPIVERRGRSWKAKLKHLVVHRILHLDDTPHRIAFGVFLGFVVGATPTLGLQMIIYFAIASVVRANKISGILPIWLSNPITAVPLYYSNWRIGQFLMGGGMQTSKAAEAEISSAVHAASTDDGGLPRMFSVEFWAGVWDTFVQMGVELWVGSLFVGIVFGVAGYWLTYRGVIAVRRVRARRHAF